MRLFAGSSADEVWLKAFHDSATWAQQESRNGTTIEAYRAMFEIQNPRSRWVVSRLPRLNVAFAIAEVIWILNGDNRLDFISAWNSKYQEFVGSQPEVYGAYGYRLRLADSPDQLLRAASALRHNPTTRQVVLQIYSPRSDMPSSLGEPRSQDIPCNVTSLLKIRDGKLQWSQILRSNDLVLGTPYNFVQFTCLQEIMAGWIGVEVGSYAHYSDSLHLYCHHRVGVDRVRIKPNADDLRLPQESSLKVLRTLHSVCRQLGEADSLADVTSAVHGWNGPQAYFNLLLILASEKARRLGAIQVSETLLAKCTNGALRQAQELWATGPRQVPRST